MARRTALIGFGRSHRALLRHLLALGEEVAVLDQKPFTALDEEGRALLDSTGVPYRGGADYLEHLDGFDRLFLTPGMRKDLAPIARARARGAEVTGEAAYAFAHLPPSTRTVGITGSAGKTTTTTVTAALLEASGRRVAVAGNIGRPLVELLADPPPIVVAELSSFQLELFERGPDIGAILNFAPNHLDVHGTVEAYFQAKLRLVATAPAGAPIAVPADDDRLRAAVAAEGGTPVLFGGDPDASDPTAYVDGDTLWLVAAGQRWRLAERRRVRLPGRHNVRNLLAAALLAHLAGGDPDRFGPVLEGFPGVPHRLERVAETNGVVWVNDSIATAPDRTVAALEATPGPVILIAGGYDKGLDYAVLTPHLGGVKVVLTMGPTAPKIEAACAAAGVPAVRVADLAEAVAEARRRALPGDTVLLSPAAASYDQFPDFEARGRRFRELVRGGGADGERS